MISRIRIEAFGRSAAEVEHTLFVASRVLDAALDLDSRNGETVIERIMENVRDDGSLLDWKGRTLVYANTAEDRDDIQAKALARHELTVAS